MYVYGVQCLRVMAGIEPAADQLSNLALLVARVSMIWSFQEPKSEDESRRELGHHQCSPAGHCGQKVGRITVAFYLTSTG
jgi:hypothetical protein